MTFRQGSRITAALLGAFLLFGGTAAAQVPGSGVIVKPPFVNGDCVKASGPGAISTSGTTCAGGSGTVTSVQASGGTTGLTFSGGPITTSGTLTLAGGLVVSNGGTGALTFTSNGVIYGNGTSALGVTAAGTTGQYFKGATGSAPVWGTLASDAVTTLSFGSTGLTPNSATSGAITVAGTLGFANGGTSNTAYTDGQLLIGNTATGGLSKATLTQGANVTITNGNGTITIAASGSGSTGCVTAGTATSVLTDDGAGGCTSNPAFHYATGVATLGTAGSVVGKVALLNATSGTLNIAPPTGALGTVTVTIPAATDTLVNLASAQALTNKTITFSGNTLTGVAPLASPTFTGTVTIPTPFTLGAVSVTSTGTQLNYLSAATGTTGTTSTNVVYSASPTFTGTAAFAALSATGQFTSTLSTGTAPFVVASTTNVANLNASSLSGATFAAPGAIGSGTPSTGVFTTLTANTSFTLNGSTAKTSTSGTGPILATSTGTLTSGNCIKSNAAGDLIDAGAACGTGSGGASWGGAPKTTSFTASANTVYCIDTLTTGAVTMTLPTTPSDGTLVQFSDCQSNFATANFTVTPGGSDKVMGTATSMIVSTNNAGAALRYSTTLTDWRVFP